MTTEIEWVLRGKENKWNSYPERSRLIIDGYSERLSSYLSEIYPVVEISDNEDRTTIQVLGKGEVKISEGDVTVIGSRVTLANGESVVLSSAVLSSRRDGVRVTRLPTV